MRGIVLAQMTAMQIAMASDSGWRRTGHRVVRSLRIVMLAMLCAVAFVNLVAPERLQAVFRATPQETPDRRAPSSLPMSLPMKNSLFALPTARV